MHSVTVRNGETYSVGKIICLARNYSDHIKELGNATPEKPVLFLKPATALVADGGTVVIPPYSNECHHEVELALLIGKTGKNVREEEAFAYIAGYGVALDMTLRDVQNDLKGKGLPWEVAKGFDTSCPVSEFVPAAEVTDPQNLQLTLRINGDVRQDGTTAQMINRIPQIIAAASQYFTLEPGDIILTGTPSGVGRVEDGDVLEAELPGLAALTVNVTAA